MIRSRYLGVVGFWLLGLVVAPGPVHAQVPNLRLAMGEVVVTPPSGYPMAGYYHERLATGTKDPLKTRCLYLAQDQTEAVLVGCDLTGASFDLVSQIREKAAITTRIPAENIIVFATHSHTAPDYTKELYLNATGGAWTARGKPAWVAGFIDQTVDLIARTKTQAGPGTLLVGDATQQEPVSFHRRFVMKDGSVKTWQNFTNKEVLRSAGPIDPQLQILAVQAAESQKFQGAFTSFALHLDTVGGLEWSADYPRYLEQAVRELMSPDAVHVFGLGCCGDINHVNPFGKPINKTPTIGESLAKTLKSAFASAKPLRPGRLGVFTQTVRLPLKTVEREEVTRAVNLLLGIQKGAKIDFLEQVDAYRTVMLDYVGNPTPAVDASQVLGWGLTRRWKGVGESLPIGVQVVACGPDLAFVFLPGEVFVELGLQIKRGSPFAQTFVIELSNCVETAYIPTRGAYAQGGYEVVNSMLKPGGGEMLVETSLALLRKARAEADLAPVKK